MNPESLLCHTLKCACSNRYFIPGRQCSVLSSNRVCFECITSLVLVNKHTYHSW